MMLRVLVLALFFLTSTGLSAAADQQPTPPPPEPRTIEPLHLQAPQAPAPQPPTKPPATLPPPAKPPTTLPPPAGQPAVEMPMPVPRKPRGRDLNLQVEVTINDQIGGETPQKKVVSMVVADQTMGRIRASADAQQKIGFVGTGLNVDARPTVLEGERILLELTVEYTPYRESGVTQRPTVLNESLSVIVQNGKPLVVSQAADPVTDRKIMLEVRATIAK